MTRLAGLILGAVALPLISTMPAAAVLNGNYTLAFHEGPTHERAGSVCITFTNTGNIDGFPDSGTWTISENTNGNFVVDGNMLRWYGYDGNGIAISSYNTIKNDVPGKGGYALWLLTTPPTPDGDGTTRMTAGCD